MGAQWSLVDMGKLGRQVDGGVTYSDEAIAYNTMVHTKVCNQMVSSEPLYSKRSGIVQEVSLS